MSLRYLFVLLCFLLLSCGKKESTQDNNVLNNKFSDENEDTVQLSPQEVFSAVITEDFLDEVDDDLQIYLEDEIFPLISSSEKISIDKISTSLYILSYDEKGERKNLLIQKFYNAKSDEIYFDRELISFDSRNHFLK
jgi:hypothetical protein